jgi:TRAP-type mannitol/chloroaromatic compound transport system permease small subunit
MRIIINTIDSITEWTGKTIRWLCACLVILITYEVVMRYVFDAPPMWGFETSIMIGITIFVIGWSYALRHHSHVRIDILYIHLSPRGRAIVDVVGALVVFFPLMILFTYTSIDWAREAWATREVMDLTAWYPPTGPVKTVVAIGSGLFLLQGIAEFIRNLHLLLRNRSYD